MTLNDELSARFLSQRIELVDWVSERVSKCSPAIDMYRFLMEHGKSFKYVYPPVLLGIPLPYKTIPLQCHTNSTHYLWTIQEERPDLLDDLYFVTGLYGLKAKNDLVPIDQKYFVDHHSFILHKNMVIDWTVLNHPPRYYDVDQYFGVVFSALTVLDAINELVAENLKGPMVPLMVLKDKPYASTIF